MPLPCVQKTVCACSVVFHLQCRVQHHLAFLLSFWRSLLMLPDTSCYSAVGRKWRQPCHLFAHALSCACSDCNTFTAHNENIAVLHRHQRQCQVLQAKKAERWGTQTSLRLAAEQAESKLVKELLTLKHKKTGLSVLWAINAPWIVSETSSCRLRRQERWETQHYFGWLLKRQRLSA